MYAFFEILHVIAYQFVQLIRPFMGPICFVVAWAVVIMGLWSVWAVVRDSVQRAQRMHQIPCSQCQYFSGSYLLKCPVHPQAALSEDAIGCRDFEATKLPWHPTQPLQKDA